MREESLVEGRQGRAGRPVQFLVALPQAVEGIVVEAEPDMDAMFLDALVVGRLASAGPLAAETPALLVQGDLVTVLPVGLTSKTKGGGDGGHAAAQDGDLADRRYSVHAYCSEVCKLLHQWT